MRSATIAATVTAVGRSPGWSGLVRAGLVVLLARAGVASLHRGAPGGPPRSTPRPREPSGLRRPGSSSAGRDRRGSRRRRAAYGCVAPTLTPSSSLSSLAAASGSVASVIARTTTARLAPARRRRGMCVRRARRSRTMACSPCAPRRRRSRAPRPGGRAWSASRVRADRHVVDVGVGVRRVGLGRRVGGAADDAVGADRRARCAGVSSSWPTWTPSAAQASTRSGRSLRMNSAPCASAAARKRFAASIRPSSSSDLSRSWIRSAPPRSAASRNARGRASQTRYRRASATRSRGVMPAVLQRYDLCITGARRTG